MTADKPRINPIVAERDDMIGRSSTFHILLKNGSSGGDGKRPGGRFVKRLIQWLRWQEYPGINYSAVA